MISGRSKNKEEEEEELSYIVFWCDIADEKGIYSFDRVKKNKSNWSGLLNSM
jgi:NTP pyrophosphatase (non-canonical NTP hydrolase)